MVVKTISTDSDSRHAQADLGVGFSVVPTEAVLRPITTYSKTSVHSTATDTGVSENLGVS